MTGNLFEQKLLSRNTDPRTSKDAVERMVESGELNRQEQLVYDKLKRHDRPAGWTATELAELILDDEYEGDFTKKYLMVDRRYSGLKYKGKADIATVLIKGEKVKIRRNGRYAWRAI